MKTIYKRDLTLKIVVNELGNKNTTLEGLKATILEGLKANKIKTVVGCITAKTTVEYLEEIYPYECISCQKTSALLSQMTRAGFLESKKVMIKSILFFRIYIIGYYIA